MEIILLEDIEGLGDKGDVANVARGYARNYLIPRGVAETATPAKIDEFRRAMAERKERQARNVEQAQETAATLNKTVITLSAKAGEGEKLYGSITSADIVTAIFEARELRVDKRKVRLDEPIKTVGDHIVTIDVLEGVEASVKVIVVAEE